MTTKTLLALVLCGTAATIASPARAGDAEGPGVAPASPSKMRVAVMFVPAPLGLLHSGSPESSVGSEPAFAFMTAFDFLPSANTFIGFAPCTTFHIRARGAAADAAREFDLLVRFGYGLPIGDRLRAYGYLAPGYSFESGLPLGATSQGPVIGLHAGGLYDLTPAFFLAAELGYQAGFQRGSYNQMEIPYAASFFQIGVGVGAHI